MLFGDNVYVGNTAVDAVYLGDTQVWSAIPADVKAHIARVIADGGTVPEQAKMVSMVKKLMTANLWNNCVFFGLPLGGVKKDGNQFVSKVYDLKANADLLQSTGTAQPKYDNDGSLLYDGGDDLRNSSTNLLTKLGANPSCTIAMWCKASSFIANYRAVIRLGSGTTNNRSIAATFLNGQPAYDIYGNRVIATSAIPTNEWCFVLMTKQSGALSTDNTKIYYNNINMPATSNAPTAVPNLISSNVFLGSLDGAANRFWVGSIGEVMIFDKVVSESERQFLFDMAKSNYGVV